MTPLEKDEASQALRQHLIDQEYQIIENWRFIAAHDAEMVSGHHLTRTQFLDHIPQILRVLGEYMVGERTDPEYFDHKTRQHGHQRWQQGFKLKELIRDWGHLTTVLVKTFEEFFAANKSIEEDTHCQHMLLLTRFTNEAFSSSVSEYDQMRQAEAMGLEADLKSIKEEFDAIIKSRGEMLHSVIHDLRGSMSGVAGASMVLDKLIQEQSDAHVAKNMLARSVNNVREMLESMLDLARIDAGREEIKLETLDVQELVSGVAEACRSIAALKNLELLVNGPSHMVVAGDASALRRITQNLVTNAIEYTKEGQVTVTVRLLDDDHWQLVVQDTGPGLHMMDGVPLAQQLKGPICGDTQRPEVDGHQPPQTYKGEGIGLTIVKRLCDLLHGNIRFHSEPGKGSTFRIDFPRTYPEIEIPEGDIIDLGTTQRA